MKNINKTSLAFLIVFLAACSSSQKKAPDVSAYHDRYDNKNYKITIRGGDEASFSPQVPTHTAELDREVQNVDVAIVGGGLAGLSSAVFLTDQKIKVVILEKEKELGGLAAGSSESNVSYARGAAYWTGAYEEEAKILERMGMIDYKTRFKIEEPIDSYLWNGKLYEGVWEEKTYSQLPASFALFKNELEIAYKEGFIPDQPFEESTKLDLDKMTAKQWILKMPSQTAKRTDAHSKEIYERYKKDTKSKPDMGDIIDFLNLYSRSALGTTIEKISAAGFANFYISEIDTRYTSQIGTGAGSMALGHILRDKEDFLTVKLNSTVVKMQNTKDGVHIEYLNNGKKKALEAKYAVFAAELKFAPRIISEFREKEKERTKILEKMLYANYAVHVVKVKGHPYRATYDTWTRAKDYTEKDFTDVILGRWNDPKLKGYEGYRDFKKDPPDDYGILTVYQPMPLNTVGKGFSDQTVELEARRSVSRMLQIYSPLLKEHWGTEIAIKEVETSRWPYSVHVAEPGHFSKNAKLLRKPFGKIYFANNNLGTPSFEEALFRGHCAANNILLKMKTAAFTQESWSRCPIEN